MRPNVKRFLVMTAWAAMAYVVVLGAYAWYASARERALSRATQQRSALADRVRRLEAVQRKLAEFEQKHAQLLQRLAVIDDVVPRAAALEPLKAALDELARVESLTLQRTTSKPEVSKGFYAEIPVELEAYGTRRGAVGFFRRLPRLPRLLTASDVRIEQVEGQRYRLVANVIAYRYTPKP